MSSSLNPSAVTTNLMLCVDAGNVKSYPGTGNTWYDLSGNGNNLTLINSPTFANKTFTFNGTNQYANGSTITVDYSQGATVEMWINSTNMAGLQGPFQFVSSPAYLNLYLSAGKLRWEAIQNVNMSGGNYVQFYTNSTLSNSTWYHISATVTSTGLGIIFINGKPDTSNQGGVNVPSNITSAFIIGLFSSYFSGQIATCKVYNRSLSANEVAQNFNATRGRFGL